MTYGQYPDLKRVKRVLVIKLRHLGDVLLTTPLFSALKKALPEAEIDAYLYQEAAPIVEGHPAISSVLTYHRSWKKSGVLERSYREFQLLRSIRKNHYDLVINLTEGDRGALAARWSGALIRVGMDPRRIYTHVAKNCPSLRHTVERQLDVLRKIGIFPSQEERELFFFLSPEVCEGIQKQLPWKRYLLIHPTSRWRFKCIPVATMRSVAQALIARGERLVFTSGTDPDECAMIQEITKELPQEAYLSLAGKISLKELGALIQQCAALLCVDSLPLHLASALKTPVVVLFGPTSEITWGPWRNPYARVLTESMSCRPCYLDGCGGGKMSDCLQSFSVKRIVSELELVSKIRESRLSIIH